MLTVDALSDPAVLLVGSLRRRRREGAGRPLLVWEGHCPICRCPHELPWPDEFRPDAALLVLALCVRGPWTGTQVALGLDPGRVAEHRRVAADHTARLRRWRVEEQLRHQLAAERADDRAYRREGWDVR